MTARRFWYKELTNACWDFKVLPNGYLHYGSKFEAHLYGRRPRYPPDLDENYNPQGNDSGRKWLCAEAHDFQMLPNGNVLQLGYYLSEVDMSRVVTNGNPAALVSGAILQELDAQRNVVFQCVVGTTILHRPMGELDCGRDFSLPRQLFLPG